MTRLGIVFDAYQIEVVARTQAKKCFRYNPEKTAGKVLPICWNWGA
ncbi:hypothetical protein [Bartonella sp. CM87QHHN]